VTALTKAYNETLDRLEDERRESGRRVLAAQERCAPGSPVSFTTKSGRCSPG
jgi:hypothetical protein